MCPTFRLMTAAGILVCSTSALRAQDSLTVVIAANYTAKETCSGRFIAGYDSTRTAEDVERFVPFRFRTSIDAVARRVTVRSADGIIRGAALFRPGLGCVTLVGDSAVVSEQSRRAERLRLDPGPRTLSTRIGTSLGYAPASAIDRGRLEAALDEAFGEPDPKALRRTRAVVVVHDGRVVAERYAPGIGPETMQRGWSMSKSVTAALVGTLIQAGRLDLLRPLPVPEWQDSTDRRGRLALGQLLEMTTGLEFDERYEAGATDVARMLFSEPDAGAFAANKPLVAPPDSIHRYSSGTSNILSRALRRIIGPDPVYWRYPDSALFRPLGIRMILETDPSGTFVGSSFSWTTARGWARLGQLFLENGVWNGKRILPDGWARYVATPTPADPRQGYGAHFATNAGGRWPALPRDLYLMSGFDGQFVFIVPSHRTVVVRLGQSAGATGAPQLMEQVLAALPPMLPLASSVGRPRRDTTRVLLVGNSYTYVNDLGDILKAIADGLPDGPVLDSRMVVRGGARLAWHEETGTIGRAMDQTRYDAVVLQEQSRLLPPVAQLPPAMLRDTTDPLGTPEFFHATVRRLAPAIRAHGATPYLFATWPRRDHFEQLEVLARAYESVGRELGIAVAPVGRAWADARAVLPDLNLYWFDRSHPGPAGSYLAALVLYATLTGRNPEGAPARIVGRPTNREGGVEDATLAVLVDLPVATARALQRVAWARVRSRR